MKRTLIYIIALSIALLCKEFTDVKGTGTGCDEKEALTAAKKNALENAVGVFLSSESIVENYMTISDVIISKSNGFIKSYDITESGRVSDSEYKVGITANITDVIDGIVQDDLALEFLMKQMNLPTFAVVISDNEDKPDGFAASSVKKYLLKKGLKIKAVKDTETKDTAFSGPDFTLKGRTDYAFISLESVYNIKTMKSLQTTMYLEMIDNRTDEIISTHTVSAKKAHISENTAKTITLQQLGPQIAAYILQESVKHWSDKLLED